MMYKVTWIPQLITENRDFELPVSSLEHGRIVLQALEGYESHLKRHSWAYRQETMYKDPGLGTIWGYNDESGWTELE